MQMPGYVAPGQSVDVAVTFTAPSAAGHYVELLDAAECIRKVVRHRWLGR